MTFERRMSHLDALLFALETPTNHMHLGLLATFSRPAPGVDIAQLLRDHIGSEAAGYNSLRLVVNRQLGGLASPVLIDAGPVDLSYHVREVTLEEPTDEALNAWVNAELSVPLDRSRPLWTVTVVKNYADGGFALFVKGHHGVFDGVAALKVVLQILEEKPLRVERRRPTKTSPWRNFVESVGELALWPARVVHVLADNTRHSVRLADLTQEPGPFRAPRTPLNISIGKGRAIARTTLPLSHVADVRRSSNCTANDVVIALVASSVRRILSEKRKLPRRDMIAIIPAAQSGSEWGGRSGNRLAFWFVSMATSIADPIERLRVIAESSKKARDGMRLRGVNLWDRYAGAILPGPYNLFVRMAEKLKLSNYVPPLGSMIISNITGPRNAIQFAGATMTGVWPLGPPKDGGAVNVTMVSYGETLYVGLQGDGKLAGLMDDIAAGLPVALSELEGALIG